MIMLMMFIQRLATTSTYVAILRSNCRMDLRLILVSWVLTLAASQYGFCSEPSTIQTTHFCVSDTGNCSDPLCGQRCHPLMWFVDNAGTIPNNSRIIFEPGDHSLSSNVSCNASVTISDKENLILIGSGSRDGEPQSQVVCTGSDSGFFFQNSSNVSIHNISFLNCGSNITIGKAHLKGCVSFHLSYDISLSAVDITGCKGLGLHMDNICGQIIIQDSTFSASQGGNAVFWFKHCRSKELIETTLTIQHSEFLDGHFIAKENATGLYIKVMCPNLNATLSHLTFRNNTGNFGGNFGIMFIDFAENTSTVMITDSVIEQGTAKRFGGGLVMWFERSHSLDECVVNTTTTILSIQNTMFHGNLAKYQGGGAIRIVYHERLGVGCTIRQVDVIDCTFTNNKAVSGSAIEVSKHNIPTYLTHTVPQFMVLLQNCSVDNNRLRSKHDQYNADGTVELFSVEKFVINNSNFSSNNGSALMLVNSGVQFEGVTIFEGNSARYGGAIKLCESSKMYFSNNTRVRLLSNSADLAGGAIYAGNQCLQETPPCFFQLLITNLSRVPMINELADDILFFEGNYAKYAGKAIYGGSVDYCFTDTELRIDNDSDHSYYHSRKLLGQIFNFSDPDEPSLITSDPYGVCLCDPNTSMPQCNITGNSTQVYAGQAFTLHVSAVGQMNGSVPSKILIAYNETKQNFTVKQKVMNPPDALCQELQLSVYPNNENIPEAFIRLGVIQTNEVSESSNYYRLPMRNITVEIQPCPDLFPYSKHSNSCDCPPKHDGLTCDINDQSITRKNYSYWIGCTKWNASGDCEVVATSSKCQNDQCSEPNGSISIHNLSQICADGWDGRLCGRCHSNYSLSLGPPQCIESACPTWQLLLLLLAFLLTGILIYFFLAVLNLTVTEGTMNGLLFYANCVHANQESFYNSEISFFRMFISWLNLDVGFPLCFYSGMTAYQKSWLEFGFLLYLLLLGVLIVFLSRRFIWFTRLAGRNVVPVLSTVILLAYPKLVRNSIKVWQCTQRQYWSSDGIKPWIWISDQSIDCFVGKHIALLVIAIFLFAAAFLYTLCLLLIQCLQRGSSWCVLRWVNKLRPFFDANSGPCRDHYRFWPGLLLFARLGMYITFWPIHGKDGASQKSYVMLGLCVFIFFLACVSPRGVYKKWPLNLLEFSFFFNLVIASAAVAEDNWYKWIFADISISITGFTFLVILAYHCYKRISETGKWRKLVTWLQERRNTNRDIENIAINGESEPLIQPRVIQFTAPREPLLEGD